MLSDFVTFGHKIFYNMKSLTTSLGFCLISTLISATNLQITHTEFQVFDDTTKSPRVKFNISWDNAWNNDKNYDAVWLFVKFNSSTSWPRHARVAADGHQVLHAHNGIEAEFSVPEDRNGLFLFPNQKHRGEVNWTVEIMLDKASLKRIDFRQYSCDVYGIEMVYIPEGAFTLGDPGEEARRFNSFYKSDGNGNYGGLYQITSKTQVIEIGPEAGKLYYDVNTAEYQGDQTGTIPGTFPNGYGAFYMMKYELRQGQYAAFLNAISASQSQLRVNFSGKNYYKNRGSIYYDHETQQYLAKSLNRPCNYITWDDAMAYTDWAALRPMTELEFTKACRGPGEAIAGEFPWGSNSKRALQRGVNRSDDLVMFNGMDESQLTEETRTLFGASYYWVMDLAGSVWEKVVTIGHEKGRAFQGTHGDGNITGFGDANVAHWPKGFDEGGYGYRGGGYYTHGKNYGEFNPHSPIAYRRFGSWSSGNRSVAYSTRMVRTAN